MQKIAAVPDVAAEPAAGSPEALDPVTGLPAVKPSGRSRWMERWEEDQRQVRILTAAAEAATPSPPSEPAVQPTPRVALSRDEAARALGMSLDSFERHVQPDLRLIRRGRMRLVDVRELERWAEDAGERTLP